MQLIWLWAAWAALAVGSSEDPNQVSQPAQPKLQQQGLQGAVDSAKSVLKRITDLGSSVESGMRDSVRSAEKDARQRAESDLGLSHEQLSEHFVSLQKEAATDVAHSKIDAARQALQQMEATDGQLHQLEARAARFLDDASRHLEESGRDAARKAQEQADQLAREARRQTDNLDRVSRKLDVPSMADRFDRMAEKAARQVSDVAEKGARSTEDAARRLSRDFNAKVAKARQQRREALSSVSELLNSAESKEAGDAPVALVSRKQGVQDVRVLVVGAAFGGAAAAVLVTLVLRSFFKSDDDLDKYLLVV